jgi:hypothetical protein
MPMDAKHITLGDAARAQCGRFGVEESAIKIARAGSVTVQEGREYIIVYGELPDGRRVRMCCQYGLEHHVVTFRPVE